MGKKGNGKSSKLGSRQGRPGESSRAVVGGLMQRAVALHQGGQLEQAQDLYRQVLKLRPQESDAWNLLGLSLYQRKDHAQAIRHLRKAVALDAKAFDYHNNLALAYKADGQMGHALKSFQAAAALDDRQPGLHYNLGNIHKAQGELAQAEASYVRALEISPDYPEALNNLGLVLAAQERNDEALTRFKRAIELRPSYGEALNNLGSLYKSRDRWEEARKCFQEALAVEPDHFGALYNLGTALIDQGELDQAVALLRQAGQIKPESPDAHNNLGVALNCQGKTELAVALYRKALELKPDYVEAYNNLAMALNSQGRLEEAEQAARRALELHPDFAEAHNNLGNSLKDSGRLEEGFAHYKRAVEILPSYAAGHSNLLMCLNYDPTIDEQGIYDEHLNWFERHGRPLADRIRPHANRPDPDRRLRVGYVSADFYRHTVAYYLIPVLEAHDRGRLDFYCYYGRSTGDDMTRRFQRQAAGWRVTVGMSDEKMAQQIRDDGIDILVDLSGHTAHNRLVVFAHKPAPVQVSWLGYFNTSGMATMDYVLMDPWTVPPGGEKLFAEHVVRLPYGRFCYEPPSYAPPVAPLPALKRGYVTFGSFNNLTKVSPQVVALWSRILEQVPRSKLLLKWKTLGDPTQRERLEAMFADNGIGPERLDLRGPTPHSRMLEEYGDMDLALDPFPFSGGVTSCEALWMGVPVITLPGDRPVSRQTLGFLAALGLEELVAPDQDRYVDLARSLAADLTVLARLRAGLRERMRVSPLCDSWLFTRPLEEAYREMWRRWCAGQGRRDELVNHG